MLVPDKRAALYTTEVVETDGERERLTTASRFNIPNVFKFTADFAKALKEVAERGSARCTSTMSTVASVPSLKMSLFLICKTFFLMFLLRILVFEVSVFVQTCHKQ